MSSLTGRQHWLAERPIGGKHRSSERPPLSATEWIVASQKLMVRGQISHNQLPCRPPTIDQNRIPCNKRGSARGKEYDRPRHIHGLPNAVQRSNALNHV